MHLLGYGFAAVACLGSTLAAAAIVEPGDRGLTLRSAADQPPILVGLGYRAFDDQGVVFETTGAELDAEGKLQFSVQGPEAAHATVSATLAPRPHGCVLDWEINYTGPPKNWNPWTSGFFYIFGAPLTGAQTQPLNSWVAPTGAHPWEVPGDTPYPQTEGQLRVVLMGDTALAMVASAYDPDWIFGNDINRASFARHPLPKNPPHQIQTRIAFLVVPADDIDPAALAAEAAGRPVALTVRTDREFNLYAPGETVRAHWILRNVTETELPCTLSIEGWTYQGERALAHEQDLRLAPAATETVSLEYTPQQRGILFLATRLRWEGGERIDRTTVGVLPERKAQGTAPSSPFGMAAVIAVPAVYPDHYSLETVLSLVERAGVRWIRGPWIPFKENPTEADDASVREKVSLLAAHGILPHVQFGAQLVPPEEREDFVRRVASTLSRYGWVTPYIEFGNELNFSATAEQYIEGLLRPVSETMRRVFPEGKVMTMGLGGVMKGWLDEFVAAGGMELVDVLSVHPGSQPKAPEFWEGWRGWVFRPQMLDTMKAAREHGGKEVWITEAYAPTYAERSGVDLRTSADYLVRTYVCSLGLGVKVIEWYQFQDGVWYARTQVPTDQEHNFGIVYTDLTPKPAYVAYATMTEQLEGAHCLGRLDLGADDLYGVRFLRNGQTVDVLWSYREKHETDLPWWPPENYANASRKPGEPWVERWKNPVTVELPAAGQVTVTDIMGNPRTLEPEEGRVRLALTGSPVYVTGLGTVPVLARFWEDIP